ncbi:hypothetical protein T11_6590 [Trichinella zimbabwensis]|uniref:Uncharacterized protein n=1 Tax=Trichinella zimbabwensis TaxID=268475 RepID=A0A0V1GF25_9BILA|nr:hypothetical protein T11_6590 [Trichinella zimbabwensis]
MGAWMICFASVGTVRYCFLLVFSVFKFKNILSYCTALLRYQIGLSIIADFTISYFFIFWLLICKISLQWNRPLKAVLAYALALRGGGSGVDLTLQVLINVAWRR